MKKLSSPLVWLVALLIALAIVFYWQQNRQPASASHAVTIDRAQFADSPVYPMGDIQWELDPAAAFGLATQDRPVLVFFTADWCPPCKMMKDNVFTDPRVQAYIKENFVPFYVDMTLADPGKAAIEFEQRYDIPGYPTQLILDRDGKMLAPMTNVLFTDDMLAWFAVYEDLQVQEKPIEAN